MPCTQEILQSRGGGEVVELATCTCSCEVVEPCELAGCVVTFP